MPIRVVGGGWMANSIDSDKWLSTRTRDTAAAREGHAAGYSQPLLRAVVRDPHATGLTTTWSPHCAAQHQ